MLKFVDWIQTTLLKYRRHRLPLIRAVILISNLLAFIPWEEMSRCCSRHFPHEMLMGFNGSSSPSNRYHLSGVHRLPWHPSYREAIACMRAFMREMLSFVRNCNIWLFLNWLAQNLSVKTSRLKEF